MRIPAVLLKLTLTALFCLFTVTACAPNQDVDIEVAPTEVLLEHVLERTESAMQDVTTYRTRETTVSTDTSRLAGSGSETRFINPGSSERQAHDRYRFLFGSPGEDGVYYFEAIVLGSQSFIRESDLQWREQQPVLDRGERVSPAELLLSFLDLDGIQLISSDEVLEDGTQVYRLGVTEVFEELSAGPDSQTGNPQKQVKTRKTSVLIDRESFRIVGRIFDTSWEFYSYSTPGDEVPVHVGSGEIVNTQHIYDYNQPVVIEAPAEYVPWPASGDSQG